MPSCRLSMNLLIKNEVDIIADNLKYHSQVGVDQFVIMDNGSTDGTRELIESLKEEYELHIIDRPVADYQQSNWKTEMAKVAKKRGAHWVITNDADEFWVAKSGSLKKELTETGSIITCPRRNVLFSKEAFDSEEKYYHQDYVVKYPINYPKGIQQKEPHLSIMLGNIHGKVMVNTKGLLRVKGGNHRAWHLWGWLNQTTSSDVTVYHFPIRSKSHFLENVENRKQLLASGVTKMGDHYKRWVKMLEKGEMEQELNRLVLSQSSAEVLLDLGVIEKDKQAIQTIAQALMS
ncbi:MAG: glycosyltransferase family 2 protein [Cellvibrionales bacterium]|nr:glycosyltransferase family 2 protein [Cellvibrionales bacterium]